MIAMDCPQNLTELDQHDHIREHFSHTHDAFFRLLMAAVQGDQETVDDTIHQLTLAVLLVDRTS